MKIYFSHRFCFIPIDTKELAGQHDWDDYEFQGRTPNADDYGAGVGVGVLSRLLGRGGSNTGGCRFSYSSFRCKTDIFCEEGLLLGVSKGNARVEILASFFFLLSVTNRSQVLNTYARSFDSDACATF